MSSDLKLTVCSVCGEDDFQLQHRPPFWFCSQCDKRYQVIENTFRSIPIFDPVNKPKHYNIHPSGVECIQITEHMNFCRGNAIKYIWRAGDKGNEIQDLEKAVWYLNKEIERLKKASCEDQSK